MGDGVSADEDNLCPNGAAYWLWIAGILLLVSNSINGWAKMYKKCAERDGKIDCGEKVGMAINSFSSGVMPIVDFVILILKWVLIPVMIVITCFCACCCACCCGMFG